MILLDTNILLDVVLEPAPHQTTSAALLDHIEQEKTPACVAWHTVATVYYFANRDHGHTTAMEFIRQVVRTLEVVSTGTESIRLALDLRFSDFEDAMQAAAAVACGAEFIVTRDEHGFDNSPIPAISPSDALERLR